MSRFVFTGGHHNSALALAEYFVAQQHQVFWYGHQQSSRGDQNNSAEYTEVIRSHIPFTNLVAGRGQFNLLEFIKFPLGIILALAYLRRDKPTAIITFGGYLGLSVALSGFLLGIPVFLHEQTVVAGKANKIAAYLAQKTYLTWEQSRKYFPATKTLVVGLPLRSNILNSKPKPLFPRAHPTIIVMGGKQGANKINQFIFSNLDKLLLRYNLIHQTGSNSQTQDYQMAQRLKKNLGKNQAYYLPLPYITQDKIGDYLVSADYYLGRSGAHICYELLYLGIKSVLIPLTSTHLSEQNQNARLLEHYNLGIILPENKLSQSSVSNTLTRLHNLTPIKANLSNNAVSSMYHDIQNSL